MLDSPCCRGKRCNITCCHGSPPFWQEPEQGILWSIPASAHKPHKSIRGCDQMGPLDWLQSGPRLLTRVLPKQAHLMRGPRSPQSLSKQQEDQHKKISVFCRSFHGRAVPDHSSSHQDGQRSYPRVLADVKLGGCNLDGCFQFCMTLRVAHHSPSDHGQGDVAYWHY